MRKERERKEGKREDRWRRKDRPMQGWTEKKKDGWNERRKLSS